MKFKYLILTAIRALQAQYMRSLLTILGIVIGIAAIIIITALGEGAQRLILDQVSGLGPETVVLRPGADVTDFTAVYAQSLTVDDVEALRRKQNVPNAVSVSPIVLVSEPIEYRNDSYSGMTVGADVRFFADILGATLADGTLYGSDAIDQSARELVIGHTLKHDIFGNERAVGKTVSINNHQFRVVGVFEKTPAVGPLEVNTMAFMPDTSAHTYITGTDYYAEIMITADSVEHVSKMAFDITKTMREQHSITYGEEDDFNLQTQEDVMERIETVVGVFTAFLVSVVAVSLVVGGIGIMNIMLVSVSERTKEIGLRKALGARRRDIMYQFLIEAMILTGIGGLIGVLAGALIALVAALALAQTIATDWVFVFPVFGAVLAVTVSVLVGIVFGLYPAHKASQKSPIEALRYE